MDKEISSCVCIPIDKYNGILLSYKKEQNFAMCSNMDRLWGYFTSERSQRKVNTVMISLILIQGI